MNKLPTNITSVVASALDEDIGSGDVTARLVPQNQTASATIISRETAVLCGQAWFEQCFLQLDSGIQIHWQAQDGELIQANQTVCTVQGNARAMLSAERSALNFLQTLSATATKARQYADRIQETGCKILDTRKTIPGLRLAQKYAIRCGGAQNHRFGLFDAVLIKENHIIAAGSISQAVNNAKQMYPDLMIEVEIEQLSQIEEAIKTGAHRLLLDNMDNKQLREAVKLADSRLELEASGGVELDNLKDIALTGVDFISVGTLTKDIKAVDLSMRFEFS